MNIYDDKLCIFNGYITIREIEKNNDIICGIYLCEEPFKQVGDITIYNINDDSCDIMFNTIDIYQNMHIATNAIMLIVEYVSIYGINSINAYVEEANRYAVKALLNNKFILINNNHYNKMI